MKQKLESLRKELASLDGKKSNPEAYNVMLGVMCDLLDAMIERLEKKVKSHEQNP